MICLVKLGASISSTCLNYPPLADSRQGNAGKEHAFSKTSVVIFIESCADLFVAGIMPDGNITAGRGVPGVTSKSAWPCMGSNSLSDMINSCPLVGDS